MRILSAKLLVVMFVFGFVSLAHGQNKDKDRKDEQRENERVNKAERAVNESKRELTKLRKELKEKLRSIDMKEDNLSSMLRSFREAEDDAEKHIGASIGIPEAMTKVKDARAKLTEASKPVLEHLHASAEWNKLSAEVEAAKQRRDELNEDPELDEHEREKELRELVSVLRKSFLAEENAIQKDSICIPIQESLRAAQEELDFLRNKISRDKIASHPKVAQASKKVEEAKNILFEERKDATTIRTRVVKAIKKLEADEAELNKARVADNKDKNSGQKKGKGR